MDPVGFRAELGPLARALLTAAGVVVACGGETGSPDATDKGTGGRSSSGGATAETGGRRSSGGDAGEGGAMEVHGGQVGKGGSISAGGPGTGGSPAGTGGSPGEGGSSEVTGGAGASAGAGTGGSGAGGARTNAYRCQNPQALVEGSESYLSCSDGHVHRPTIEACPSSLPRTTVVPNYDAALDNCETDADCADRPHGYCWRPVLPGMGTKASCVYGCVEDADCGDGRICVCGPIVGSCVSASCKSDLDCEPGFECASYQRPPSDLICSEGAPSFACQTPDDRCGGRNHCPRSGTGWAGCGFEPDAESRSCLKLDGCAVPGRPFLVAGSERVAGTCERADWQALAASPEESSLETAARERLAAHWLQAARMEHASIAAFARFTLQLLALGAPAALVAESLAAQADELRHAQLCFGVASAYAGRPLGPSSLEIDGSLTQTSLVEIAILALREGCVGETLAAAEAAEAAAHALDPALRELLRAISEDEARHAELAFRFVRWAVEQVAPGSADALRLRAELAACRRAAPGSAEPADDAWLLEHGALPAAHSAALRRTVLSRVVAPCLAALEAPLIASNAPRNQPGSLDELMLADDRRHGPRSSMTRISALDGHRHRQETSPGFF